MSDLQQVKTAKAARRIRFSNRGGINVTTLQDTQEGQPPLQSSSALNTRSDPLRDTRSVRKNGHSSSRVALRDRIAEHLYRPRNQTKSAKAIGIGVTAIATATVRRRLSEDNRMVPSGMSEDRTIPRQLLPLSWALTAARPAMSSNGGMTPLVNYTDRQVALALENASEELAGGDKA